MPPSIPASQIVSVIPSILSAGGNPLALNAVFLTQDASLPIGQVRPFASLDDVRTWFGANAVESSMAAIYFNGFNGATSLPDTLYFSRYNVSAAAAFLRGGSVQGLSIAQLQALSGTLIVAVDGKTVTSASIDLSGATSFSNAAALMQTGLQTAGGIFQGTANQTGASTTMTVTAVTSGALHVGDIIAGTGVTVGTTIVAQLSGPAGGAGTYTVSNSDGFSSTAVNVAGIGTVSYDSIRHTFVITSPTTGVDSSVGFATGTLSAGVKFTSATGATQSIGAAAADPVSAMTAIALATQNWATFMTLWEPILADKLLFADWVTTTTDRYAYVAWDSDVVALEANAVDSFGVLTADYDGVIPVWNVDGTIAALICAIAAALNFSETNGRATWAFKSQPGLTPEITDATTADNLISNGYNFYGAYATANERFTFLQPGQISGDWAWIDPYINQIYLNSQLQLALMELLVSIKSVPYNQQGYNLIRAACLDPINEGVNFGSIRAGVTLSASQAVQINTAAGARISDVLQTQGWYLKVSDATPQVRSNRGSPPITLWYTDGGSVQKINLASINVE